MIIGVPKEIKDHEYRVAAVPGGAHEFVGAGHSVLVERDAGIGSGIENDEYRDAGAEIVDSAAEVFGRADMIYKVKEPQPSEYPMIRSEHIVYTYFHFAASEQLTNGMIETGACCVAYETIEVDGTLPLLTPMSEVAGRLSVQEGARFLLRPQGGRGVLLGGVPGVVPGTVVILGGGVVGTEAAKMAAGLGARVIVLDINLERLRYLEDILPANVTTIHSTPYAVREVLGEADLLVGAVLVSGARAPRLVRREDLKLMKPGAVIVDVAVDQGGCIETVHPTTHSDPIYVVDGIVHYGVANMPGSVSRTSTFALTSATLRYGLDIARKGIRDAIEDDSALKLGVNVVKGKITHAAVAEAFGRDSCDPLDAM